MGTRQPVGRNPSGRVDTALALALVLGSAASAGPPEPRADLSTFWGGEPERPFDLALVLAGGGYDVFAHIGIVDAAIDLGLEPDVLVAPCGASIVAAVLNAVPDRDERLRLIFSPEFHVVMRAPQRQKLTPAMASMVFSIWRRSLGWTDKLPRLYDFPVVEFDAGFRPERLDSEFRSSGMRLVIPATRTEIGPEDRGQHRAGRKLFQEVFFTDADTARHLRGFRAPVAYYFPDSAYMAETDVRLDAALFDAVRASISDMYFVEPYLYRGERFVTGGFDLHVELAQGLARRVAVAMINGYDPLLSDAAVESVIGYRLNQRLKLSTALDVDWWIDISDKKRWGPMKFRILDGVPEDYATFAELARQQYAMGYCRGREGLTRERRGELRHIRNLNDRNTDDDLRRSVARERRAGGDARDASCAIDDAALAERQATIATTPRPAGGPGEAAGANGVPAPTKR